MVQEHTPLVERSVSFRLCNMPERILSGVPRAVDQQVEACEAAADFLGCSYELREDTPLSPLFSQMPIDHKLFDSTGMPHDRTRPVIDSLHTIGIFSCGDALAMGSLHIQNEVKRTASTLFGPQRMLMLGDAILRCTDQRLPYERTPFIRLLDIFDDLGQASPVVLLPSGSYSNLNLNNASPLTVADLARITPKEALRLTNSRSHAEGLIQFAGLMTDVLCDFTTHKRLRKNTELLATYYESIQ